MQYSSHAKRIRKSFCWQNSKPHTRHETQRNTVSTVLIQLIQDRFGTLDLRSDKNADEDTEEDHDEDNDEDPDGNKADAKSNADADDDDDTPYLQENFRIQQVSL